MCYTLQQNYCRPALVASPPPLISEDRVHTNKTNDLEEKNKRKKEEKANVYKIRSNYFLP
jgi:hypothetical protein